MNVRMVNATFEDRHRADFDADANTDRFIARIPDYAAHGVRAFTLCLQGGMPGYEGALNSAFEPDGSLRETYLRRVQRVIEACDRQGIVVILGCYYQRQSKVLRDETAVRAGVVNVVHWLRQSGFRNVLLEVANEYPHKGFAHAVIRSPEGMAALIRLAKQTWPELLVSASGYGDGKLHEPVAEASDFLLVHFNGTAVANIPNRLEELRKHGKPIVCNEDEKSGTAAATAAEVCVRYPASYGMMLNTLNQQFPFSFRGAEDDEVFYAKLKSLTTSAAITASAGRPAVPRDLPGLRVSDNGRFLITAEGKFFFWLGDTAWHMFGKSVREQAEDQSSAGLYFANRAAKGFTVIQSVIVRSPDAGSMANAYGFDPFENDDWSRPRLRPGPNDDYWDHVDWCIAEARRHGLYIAALPLWLSAIPENHLLVREPRVAYRYGHFLGNRYGKQSNLVWVLGGDAPKGRNVDNPARLAMIRALAEGIADGVNGVDGFDGRADWSSTLMTFHPPGGDHSSSEWLHAEPWLDFNMIQTTTRFNFENWRTVARDYARQPAKPTLDAEVAYEDSLSLRKTEPQDRRISPWDARRAAYWNVFAGGLGHTYGHRSFIGWIRKDETYKWGAHIPWYESLDAPGAFQMGHLRRLMLSLPDPLERVPDRSLLGEDAGTGNAHIAATRDAQGRYALVYSPLGKPFALRMERLIGDELRAVWFDPRDGVSRVLAAIPRQGVHEFTPPSSGEGNDWVLLLNDVKHNFLLPSREGKP